MTIHNLPAFYYEEVEQPSALGELFAAAQRHKFLIATVVLLVTAAAALYAFGRDRSYEAEARILIDPRGMLIVDRDIMPRSETAGDNAALVESQMRVMTSGDVLSKVVATEKLASDAEFVKGGDSMLATLRSELSRLFSSGRSAPDPKLVALFNLREAVATTRPRDSYIVDLSVRTKEPAKSARIANAIAHTYLNYEVSAHSNLARRGYGALNKRLSELRTELSEAEDKVEAYKLEHGILSASGDLINEQDLSKINERLVAARDRAAAAQSVYEQMKVIEASGQVPESLPEAVESTTIGLLRVDYERARQVYEGLSSRYLASHPVMQAAQAQLASAKAAIQAEVKRVAEAAYTNYEREQSHVRKLESQVQDLKSEAYATNDKLVKLRELIRDAEAKRDVYEAFLVRAKELNEQESVSTQNARIISAATIPLEPVGPGSLLVLALGLVGGFGLGLLLALASDSLSMRSYPRYYW